MSAQQEFCAITGADVDTARQYLESCGGDLTRAVNAFFSSAPPPSPGVAPAPVAVPQKKKPRAKPRIAGFGSLRQEEEEEEAGKQGNEYYAGGKSSGVAVVGRPDADEVAERLVSGVKQSGAVVDAHAAAEQAKWAGGGFQLGSNARVEPQAAPVQDVVRVVKLFKNGFTVDNSALRGYAENREFIDAIAQGQVPPELEEAARASGAQLKVDLVDNRGQDYEAPAQEKPRVQAFSGSGHSLGGPSAAPAPVVAPVAAAKVVVDASRPVTTLQLRLPDGSRIKAQFNTTHTLADVRAYVASERPDLSSNYTLMSTFPRKAFGAAENAVSLEQAGVLGAALLVKLN